MKNKIFAAVPGMLAVIFAAVPILFLIAVINGNYFELYHPLFVAILLTSLSVVSAAAMLICRITYRKINGAVLSLVLLFATVSTFYFVYHAVRVIDGYDTMIPAIVMAACMIASVIMYVKVIDDSVIKAAFGVVTVVFAMAAVVFAIYLLISENLFTEIKYADGPDSPDGKYSVTVTYREDGLATDGKTYVNVKCNDESDSFLGTMKSAPKRIFTGGRLDYDRIEIEWKDEEILLIDGEEYSVTVGGGVSSDDESGTESSADISDRSEVSGVFESSEDKEVSHFPDSSGGTESTVEESDFSAAENN